ncbi:AMP-dependent synthetase and ligase [Desulfarculus baarsii DSM 2075]|uniref:AMP-dependent synthetase and ligase n=1 Tax=Desulfarculus baarsii (strain ATCC 33931 / DSM 2075 / LMG 7858 / VKM B-1802 / 2st14) TaxID=644282 RepID=E1QDX5_DESB2|nr:long-chain-fatty-acid--CoA ligase [Desulfarculus baarsii]ADK83761.1 AMP-dependent synthetase and ligase [Desulfarculus baarsii DSM 2075]
MNVAHHSSWPNRMPKKLDYPQTPLHDLLATSARRFPDKPGVIYYGQVITYAQLWDQAQRLAGALAAMGLQKGDRVALYMQNCPHYLIGCFGVYAAGGVVAPLNPMLVERELYNIVGDSGARFIITTTELYGRVAPIAADLGVERVICGSLWDYMPENPAIPAPDFMAATPRAIDGAAAWLETLASAPGAPQVDIDIKADLAMLPYTAGSTGLPKGCMHTHATVMSNVWSAMYWTQLSSGANVLSCLPFFHVTGFVHSLAAPLAAGATLVMLTRWDREAALQAVEKYGVTHFVNITAMMADILSAKDIESRDLASLQMVGGGGAPLPVALGQRLKDLTGLDYVEGYGMTETISQTHFNPCDKVKLGSIGIPDFGVDARVIDIETLRELPAGQQGELVIHGPEIMLGYWNKPVETKEAFIELGGKRFLRTGDICRMDEEGYFFITDRLKRMINAAGFKVWPAEIEAVLYKHPHVLEACVISAPDAKRQETVKALIVAKPGCQPDPEEIMAWSRKEMSAYKAPRIVEIVAALPKSGAGKILWRQVQEQEMAKR